MDEITIEKIKKEEKAISLVALTVTIIVLLILAGVAITLSIGNNGIISRVTLSVEGNKLASYKEKLELYKAEKIMEDKNFSEESLSAGRNVLEYNTKKESGGTILNIIPELDEKYMDKLEIIKGELLLKSTDKQDIQVAKIAGIEFNPYKIENGVLESADTNLELMTSDGTLTIPSNVTVIGSGAFSGLEGLKKVIIPGTVKEIAPEAFSYNNTLEEVIIMNGLEKIGERAFASSPKITNIVLPESINDIGKGAFFGASIEEITVPAKVKKIKNLTFSNNYKLSKVILQEGLEEIEGGSFSNCKILDNINIPSTIKTIGRESFGSGCRNLQNITLNNDLYVYKNGLLMTGDYSEVLDISYKYMENAETFSIPEGVTDFKISLTHFGIKTINIPASLISMSEGILPPTIENVSVTEGNTKFKAVGKQLYNEGTLLLSFTQKEDIKFQDGITKIGANSFIPEKNVKTIVIPESVTSIQSYAFSNIDTLENLKIGKGVSYISSAFIHKNYDVNVEIDSSNEKYQIENNVLYSDKKTILICPLYKINGTFNVIKGVKEIKDLAFYFQDNLTEIKLPNTIETLNDNILLRCSKLEKIEIPSSIKKIGSYCFKECENLNKIIIHKKKGEIPNAPWGAPKGERIIKWDE